MRIETSRETLKEASLDLLKGTGWKPGDRFSFHSVSELMVALALKFQKGEIGCDYPSCGCCADAACDDAVKQHPDLGGTPPAPKLRVTGFRGNPLRVVLSNGDEATVTQKLIDAFASPSPFDHGVTKSVEGVTNAENGAVERQSAGQTSPSPRATANE